MSLIKELVENAKELHENKFGAKDDDNEYVCTVAPGRVNLIGEHTDYTGGFVFPLAIDYSTVVYGTGSLIIDAGGEEEKQICIEMASTTKKDEEIEKHVIKESSNPPSKEESHSTWIWYVLGVLAQYVSDLPSNAKLEIKVAIAGNVPLGGGLSSSASLEVATARFLESILGDNDHAFSSCTNKNDESFLPAKERALRCQKAENVWCHSPCGIMDQYVSSAASEGTLLLIDCTSFDFQKVQMKQPNTVVLVVTNSCVTHSIGAGEYPIRVAQCKAALEAIQKQQQQQNEGATVIQSLREATLEMVENAKELLVENEDDVLFRRARHVTTENQRTLEARKAVEAGDWKELGRLMCASHDSMRDDYETSCTEIDILVQLAMECEGVYGSRLTGGGFGGCTVTLCERNAVANLTKHLTSNYKTKTGLDCRIFETSPAQGARVLEE